MGPSSRRKFDVENRVPTLHHLVVGLRAEMRRVSHLVHDFDQNVSILYVTDWKICLSVVNHFSSSIFDKHLFKYLRGDGKIMGKIIGDSDRTSMVFEKNKIHIF